MYKRKGKTRSMKHHIHGQTINPKLFNVIGW